MNSAAYVDNSLIKETLNELAKNKPSEYQKVIVASPRLERESKV